MKNDNTSAICNCQKLSKIETAKIKDKMKNEHIGFNESRNNNESSKIRKICLYRQDDVFVLLPL